MKKSIIILGLLFICTSTFSQGSKGSLTFLYTPYNNGCEFRGTLYYSYYQWQGEPMYKFSMLINSIDKSRVMCNGKWYSASEIGSEINLLEVNKTFGFKVDIYKGNHKITTDEINYSRLGVAGSPSWSTALKGVSSDRAKELFKEGFSVRNVRIDGEVSFANMWDIRKKVKEIENPLTSVNSSNNNDSNWGNQQGYETQTQHYNTPYNSSTSKSNQQTYGNEGARQDDGRVKGTTADPSLKNNDYYYQKQLQQQQKLYQQIENERIRAEQQTALIQSGTDKIVAGLNSDDRYERGLAVTEGVATILAGTDIDPITGSILAIGSGLLAGSGKSAEEKEAERLREQYEADKQEYLAMIKSANAKYLKAEQANKYNGYLYNDARSAYQNAANHRLAGDYPKKQIQKIDYLFETVKIKNLMYGFANTFAEKINSNYLQEGRDKVYFYFGIIEIDAAKRTSNLKTSNIFAVHYNHATQSWPYLPDIKNSIYNKYKNAIIKGYFRTYDAAVADRNQYTNTAKRNYYKVSNDYYKFSFNTASSSSGTMNKSSNTDFWGNAKKSSKTKTIPKKTTPSKAKKEENVDFWGNPIKKKKK